MSKIRLCLDLGHGGKDPGAVGQGKLYEKDVNLAIGKFVENDLVTAGFEVVLTRNADTEVNPKAKTQDEELQARCDIANKNKADFFISIHCNSFSDRTANGTEIIVIAKGGKAEQLANSVLKHLIPAQAPVKNRGVITKNLHVLRETDMPAILIENLFISNPTEEKRLSDPRFQLQSAKAIARGVIEYLSSNLSAEIVRLRHELAQALKERDAAIANVNLVKTKVNIINALVEKIKQEASVI